MEYIELKDVLERLALEIWKHEFSQSSRKKEHRMPSLNKQNQLAEELLHQAYQKDNKIYLYNGIGNLSKIPFYNYVLLIGEQMNVEGFDYIDPAYLWKVVGFQRSADLFDYIIKSGFLWPATIFVKVRGFYEKATCRYAFQRPDEEKQYVNLWRFYHPDNKGCETPIRTEEYQYFVEIDGLCEIEHDGEIECFFVNSYCDIDYVLDLKTEYILKKIVEDNFPKDYMEKGMVFYNNQMFPYYIKVVDNTWVSNKLMDLKGRSYCSGWNEFTHLCSEFHNNCEKCYQLTKEEKQKYEEVWYG